MREKSKWYLDSTFLMTVAFFVSYLATRELRAGIWGHLIVLGKHIHHWQLAMPLIILVFVLSRHWKSNIADWIFDLAGGALIGILFDEFDMWWIDMPNPDDTTHKGLIAGLICFGVVVLIRLLPSNKFLQKTK